MLEYMVMSIPAPLVPKVYSSLFSQELIYLFNEHFFNIYLSGTMLGTGDNTD